jgi:polysaccharide biosynthesis protein PslG
VRRAFFLVLLVASVLAPCGSAAERMVMGLQDDPSFRWSPDSVAMLDRAEATGVSLVRTVAEWRELAPTRPANPTDSFDPAYRLSDLDDFVRRAQQRGMEVLITVFGTPGWANGGQARNVAPTNVDDLRAFCQALADRYSGRHPGYPFVGRWSVWNEPNLGQFLRPQYDAKGRIVSPRIYARLYRAAYAGIKAGNPLAKVAIGETSARGRDHPSTKSSDTVSPGRFAELLAQADRKLRFDAWAQHPYPTTPSMRPLQKVNWPNVTLTGLDLLESAVDRWFKRRNVPIWVTEYGHETRPAEPLGVSNATQAAYARTAVEFARQDPRVQVFVWFVFRDSSGSTWQSGFYASDDNAKVGLGAWTSLVTLTNGVTQPVIAGTESPTVRVAVPKLAFYDAPGSTIGLTYRVSLAGKLVAVGQPAVPLTFDGSIAFPVAFTPLAGKTYTLTVDANDAHGNRESASYALVAR